MEKMNNGGFLLRIISPDEPFFEGNVESVIVKTVDGYVGFLKDRAPSCMLVPADGEIKVRMTKNDDFKVAKLNGGFCYMNKKMVIYTDKAEWSE